MTVSIMSVEASMRGDAVPMDRFPSGKWMKFFRCDLISEISSCLDFRAGSQLYCVEDGKTRYAYADDVWTLPTWQRKMWAGVVLTNGSGVWSADFTAAGFTAPPIVNATAVGVGSAANNSVNANSKTSITALLATGIAVQPIASILGLITVQLVAANTQVHVLAVEAG